MNIYVGNLNYRLTEDELKGAFETYGEVASVRIITDKFSGRSKGFGFIEMMDSVAGEKAIEALNQTELGGRNVVVNQAREKSEDR